MKCNHRACTFSADNKPLADAVRPEAVMQIDGMSHGETMYWCKKHFDAFDTLHRVVLAFEPRCKDKTAWKPTNVSYSKLSA